MSTEQLTYIEQDSGIPDGQDDLPTYDDLAAQNGPNSRFGRWRGWIEKRAAERYVDVTPQERARRRERGWGNEEIGHSQAPPIIINESPTFANLHIETNGLEGPNPFVQEPNSEPTSITPPAFASHDILPTHLKMNQFGSRFLPHTTSQIRCVLPLVAERLLLIGHDEGLSVLDIFPQEWTENGEIAVKGPDEAQARAIWRGESVYQMTVLEVEGRREGTPQGVVLALVGPESESQHHSGALRMYNLASLTSLARWAVAQKGARPLDLNRPSNWQVQQSPKRHRAQGSIARSLKSLIETPSTQPEPATSSFQSLLTSTSSTTGFPRTPSGSERGSPARHGSEESAWDMVDDLPLRWATDFVPLASPGSRLVNTSVTSYATWYDVNRKGGGGQLLAIATKSNIFLYETPKGERAYRFVKDFYTPMQPKSLTFFNQSVQENARIPPEKSHRRSDSSGTIRIEPRNSSASTNFNYGTHLSLFVIFDKKAGWIRLADSAVGEFFLSEDDGPPPTLQPRDTFSSTLSQSTIRSRSRLSSEIRETGAKWVPPVRCELPLPGYPGGTREVYCLSRGKRTHILPCPLPVRSQSQPPLHVVYWKTAPKYVAPRVCLPPLTSMVSPLSPNNCKPPLFQLIAFGENGIEIQELSLSFLDTTSKGKAKATSVEVSWAEEDLGGDTGFLAPGGNWDLTERLYGQGLERGYSAMSASSGYSFASAETEDIAEGLKAQAGVYGWCRKGFADWRVFWVGGSHSDLSLEEVEDPY